MILKIKIGLIITAALVSLALITSSYTSMFGRQYKEKYDFSCCQGDQLVVHHFYLDKFFWVEIDKGYIKESIGKPIPGGCNVQCEE